MFKLIGAIVVYGLALFGAYHMYQIRKAELKQAQNNKA